MASSKIECGSTAEPKCTLKAFTTSNGARTTDVCGNQFTTEITFSNARLKALELDARKAGIHTDEKPTLSPRPAATMIASSDSGPAAIEMSQMSKAAGVIFRGVESYLHEIINAAVLSQLAALGITRTVIEKGSASLLSDVIDHPSNDVQPQQIDPAPVPSSETGRALISEAIESYLKDVEPPQREQKTYDEYRLVLYKFRDTCGKRYLQEISRDDCLSFMRPCGGQTSGRPSLISGRYGLVHRVPDQEGNKLRSNFGQICWR
jgi:hypothetical protein